MLVLISLGANVNAEDIVAEMLVDRAGNSIIFTGMDNAVMAKSDLTGQGMASTAGQGKAPPKVSPGRPQPGTATAGSQKYVNRDGSTRRVFGGTNSRNNKDPAVMAKLKGKAQGMYGQAMGSGTWYSGGGPLAWNRFNTDNQPDKKAVEKRAVPRLIPNIKQISGNAGGSGSREGQGKRIFGGTNSRNSNNPAVMARLKGKGALMYGKMSSDRPLNQPKR